MKHQVVTVEYSKCEGFLNIRVFGRLATVPWSWMNYTFTKTMINFHRVKFIMVAHHNLHRFEDILDAKAVDGGSE